MSIEPNLSALREQGSITYNSQCSERPPLLQDPTIMVPYFRKLPFWGIILKTEYQEEGTRILCLRG